MDLADLIYRVKRDHQRVVDLTAADYQALKAWAQFSQAMVVGTAFMGAEILIDGVPHPRPAHPVNDPLARRASLAAELAGITRAIADSDGWNGEPVRDRRAQQVELQMLMEGLVR